MTEDQEISNLEENLPMVNYIMLHRIYDMLSIIANKLEPELTAGMINLHENGRLVGPMPAFIPGEENE